VICASQVSSVDFHANCNYIVGGSDDRYVRVWDVLSGACVRTFTGHRAPVRCTKFSPCGRYVVSVDGDGVTLVWDVSSQRLMGGDTRKMSTRIPSLSWSRDGGTFALSRGGSEMSLYSLDNLIMASNPLLLTSILTMPNWTCPTSRLTSSQRRIRPSSVFTSLAGICCWEWAHSIN
ncbi:hypothetical protein PMAYCL1PPCAC_23636, partial [Pristionchus mayeri]